MVTLNTDYIYICSYIMNKCDLCAVSFSHAKCFMNKLCFIFHLHTVDFNVRFGKVLQTSNEVQVLFKNA